MFGKISRGLLAVSVAIVIAGCNSTSPTEGLSVNAQPAPGAQPTPVVVQALCPPVVTLEQTAIYRSYAKGGDNNPDKLAYQAAFGDMTRQCTANETMMTVHIVAQGRIVQGPVGTPGRVTLPVVIDVIDGEKVLFSKKVAFPVQMDAGGSQFLFDNVDTQIPNAVGGATESTRVRIGFDTGATSKKPTKPARRG